MKEYFIALSELLTGYDGPHRKVIGRLSDGDKQAIRALGTTDGDIVRAELIERFTEHDTAARGDYLKLLIGTELPHLESMIEGMAFANTSEDTMSSVFGLIGNKLVYGHFIPQILDYMEGMLEFVAHWEHDGPLVLPAMTHQQAAEPTTLGKKVTTNLWAMNYHIEQLLGSNGEFTPFGGKLGGADGNMATHFAAYPDVDWRTFAQQFIERIGLTYDEMTFQASTYAVEADILTTVSNIIPHMIKLQEDFIRMNSTPAQFFVKQKRPGTKGSSIMPNKSNLWATEGAIQMMRKSMYALRTLADSLRDYPHEGDMGRSYMFRAIGTDFMPAFIGTRRVMGEILGRRYPDALSGLAPNQEKIDAFFHEYPGMAGSTLQTIMKREGIEGDAYREIERISINDDGSYANAEQFAEGLERAMAELQLSDRVREELRSKVIPENNIGDAADIAMKQWGVLEDRIACHRQNLAKYEGPLLPA